MAILALCLLGAWAVGQLLIVGVAARWGNTRALLYFMACFLILVYLTKPYTYDLKKYSIYFATGFIQTQTWHMPDGHFHLDPKDTTGDPYEGSYEPAFRRLAEFGNEWLPKGSLWPRVDFDYDDFKERGPPRSDATIVLVALAGFVLISLTLTTVRRWDGGSSSSFRPDFLLVSILILGSIFFLLGSQNTLRQFLGMSIAINGIVLAMSRRYVLGGLVCLLSVVVHQWMPLLGAIGIVLAVATDIEQSSTESDVVLPLRATRIDVSVFLLGCIAMVAIKAIGIFGLFTMELPMVVDFKHYLIDQNQYESLERISGIKKAGLLALLVLASEMILGATRITTFNKARSLRRKVLLFILPLAMYPEIFSRVLIIYWVSELIFLIGALSTHETRIRMSGAFVFCAYGIAPNAINIIIGPAWLFAL